jgi:thymidine phosphorylase
MVELGAARELARSLVAVANAAGLRTSALITDMHEPLASAAGNSVEVANAVDYLTGRARDSRLHTIVLASACEMLTLGGIAGTPADAEAMALSALDSGRAAEIFGRMVRGLGGPADFVENPAAYLPHAPVVRDVAPASAGTVARIDTRALGLVVVALGGGRTRAEDGIDHAVGLTQLAGIGDDVGPERPLCRVRARDDDAAARAAESVRRAYWLGEPPRARRLIYERILGS